MGTRGFLGLRNNKKLLLGRYNSLDSYYDSLGKEVIDFYFNNKRVNILGLSDNNVNSKSFLQDGLFCEFAYVYNEDNDTLEIYRGFFKKKQHLNSDIKIKIIDALEDEDKDKYYCHLIMIIDKKKHTKKQVLKAFETYSIIINGEGEDEDNGNPYPERKIIPLKINKDYIPLT